MQKDETRGSKNWHEKAFLGLHYDLHARSSDRELFKNLDIKKIRRQWAKIKPDFVQSDCKGHPGYASYPTKVGTPVPGIKKDALKLLRKLTREMRIPLVVHYSGVIDHVAAEKNPGWQQKDAAGSYIKGNMCSNGPYLTMLLIPQLLEIVDFYDIDGVWMDGENWAARPCWCRRCRTLFLKKYKDAKIPYKPSDKYWSLWLAFQRECFTRYVTGYTEAVHRKKPSCLVCSNWLYSSRQPEKATVPVDFLSGDFTFYFGLDHATIESRFYESRGIPWNLMAWTFQRVCDVPRSGNVPAVMKTAEHLKQETAEIIMNGGKIAYYDNPKRTGELVKWHSELIGEVAAFAWARRPFCQDTEGVPQAAVLHSAHHYYKNAPPLYGTGDGYRSLGEAIFPVEGALHSLLQSHYQVSVLNEEALLERAEQFNFIVVPEQTSLPFSLIKKLAAYVQNGGRLLLSGSEALDAFGKYFGLPARGKIIPAVRYLPLGKTTAPVLGPWRLIKDGDGPVPLLDGVAPDDFSGAPAVTWHRFGKGTLLIIHGAIFETYGNSRYPQLRKFLTSIFTKIAPPQLVSLTAPPWVEMSLRRKGDNLLIHLLNRNASPSLSPYSIAVEEVPSVGPVGITVRCKRKPEKAHWEPENGKDFRWHWRKGRLEAEISRLFIHGIVVVKGWE